MFQKLLNYHSNYEDLQINDSFIQGPINPTNDYYLLSISNLNFLNKCEYEKEDEPLINEFKEPFLYSEFNCIEPIDKGTKQYINEKTDFKNKLLDQKEFSFENKSIDSPKQNTGFLDNNKSKSKLIKKSRLFLKRKNDNTFGKHTKYADDNLRRKIKNLVLKYALEFLNEKIRVLYKGNIGKGISKKELVPLNNIYKVDTSIENNKNFIKMTLGEIFSANISTRFKSNFPDYNKILIKRLLNDRDENKRFYFQRLFNIKFLKCVEAFSGSDNCEELKGFKTFREIKNSFDYEHEPEYIKSLEFYLKNFDEIIKNKKGKKVRQNKEQKGKKEECKEKK